MYLSTLQVRNFRNYDAEVFKFNSATNTIIGENDSGKTSALTALRILLDDSYYYSNKTLKESDFFDGLSNGWQGEWIIISATFEGMSEEELVNEICASITLDSEAVTSEDENQTILKELISNTYEGVGSISLFIRPNKIIRKQLYDASIDDDTNLFDNIRHSIRLSDYEFHYTSKSNLNFCNNDKYHELLGNLDDYKPSNPEEDDEALLGAKIDMSDIFKHISVVYVDALRDVLREMKNNRNPVKKIIETIESQISSENIEHLKSIIQQLNESITSVPEIKNIGEELNLQLNSIIGSVYSPNLLLSSNMSDDMSSLSKYLSMKPEQNLDIDLLGLGHLNMIYLALKIVEFEVCRSRELLNIMLIEEPEAHIHHHIQKTLFEGLNLQKNYTQIMMTTHSVHLAEASEISRMNVLKSFDNKTIVMQPAKNLNTFAEQRLNKRNLNLISSVERYLDVKRNGLLFSKSVILVEGDAEEILIPQLVKKVFGINLDELGIGLVNLGSTSFEYIASLFDNDRIQRKCAIITDLDRQVIPTSHQLYKEKAEELGQTRQEKLSRIFDDNRWVSTFYANSTFELELLNSNIENIENYVYPIIENSFVDRNSILRYKSEIKSNDYLERNLAMLKLANHVGKGWFSIGLSEQIDREIKIPRYIIDAIAFACQETVNIEIYKKILLYSICSYENNEEISTLLNEININTGMELKVSINSLLDSLNANVDSHHLINQIEEYITLLSIEVYE